MISIRPFGNGQIQVLRNLVTIWMKWDKLYLVPPSVRRSAMVRGVKGL